MGIKCFVDIMQNKQITFDTRGSVKAGFSIARNLSFVLCIGRWNAIHNKDNCDSGESVIKIVGKKEYIFCDQGMLGLNVFQRRSSVIMKATNLAEMQKI